MKTTTWHTQVVGSTDFPKELHDAEVVELINRDAELNLNVPGVVNYSLNSSEKNEVEDRIYYKFSYSVDVEDWFYDTTITS